MTIFKNLESCETLVRMTTVTGRKDNNFHNTSNFEGGIFSFTYINSK